MVCGMGSGNNAPRGCAASAGLELNRVILLLAGGSLGGEEEGEEIHVRLLSVEGARDMEEADVEEGGGATWWRTCFVPPAPLIYATDADFKADPAICEIRDKTPAGGDHRCGQYTLGPGPSVG